MNDKPTTAAQDLLVDRVLGRVDDEQAWQRLQTLMPVQRAALEEAVADLVALVVRERVARDGS